LISIVKVKQKCREESPKKEFYLGRKNGLAIWDTYAHVGVLRSSLNKLGALLV
jgi:hypothetical protein